MARWVEQLASFQYRIVHRPGWVHANADALSRLPAYLPVMSVNQSVTQLEGGQMICSVQHASLEEAELVQAQRSDEELQKVIVLKSEGIACLQPPNELHKYGPVWAQLQLQGVRLVRQPPANSDAASQVQVVLPKSLVPKVLRQLHNSVTGGHLGIQKLQAKVKDRFS